MTDYSYDDFCDRRYEDRQERIAEDLDRQAEYDRQQEAWALAEADGYGVTLVGDEWAWCIDGNAQPRRYSSAVDAIDDALEHWRDTEAERVEQVTDRAQRAVAPARGAR